MPLCTELYHTIGREYIVKNIAMVSQPVGQPKTQAQAFIQGPRLRAAPARYA